MDTLKVINAQNILPGWTGSHSMKISNNSGYSMMFNIKWTNVMNNFEKDNELVYTLKRDGIVLGTYSAPKINENLLMKVLIPRETSYTYELEFEFKNLDSKQDYNQGKTFAAGFNVEVYSPTVGLSINN